MGRVTRYTSLIERKHGGKKMTKAEREIFIRKLQNAHEPSPFPPGTRIEHFTVAAPRPENR